MIVVIASDERLTRRVLQTLADLDRRTVSVASCAEVDHLSRTRAHACIYVTTELTAAAVTEMVDLQRRERCPPLIIVTRQAEVSANLAGLRVHALVSSGRLGSLPDVVRELRTSQTMAERLRQAISRLPSIDPVLVAPLIDMTRPKELRRIEALRKSELISKQRLRDALGMSATWLCGRLKAAFGGIAKPWDTWVDAVRAVRAIDVLAESADATLEVIAQELAITAKTLKGSLRRITGRKNFTEFREMTPSDVLESVFTALRLPPTNESPALDGPEKLRGPVDRDAPDDAHGPNEPPQGGRPTRARAPSTQERDLIEESLARQRPAGDAE